MSKTRQERQERIEALLRNRGFVVAYAGALESDGGRASVNVSDPIGPMVSDSAGGVIADYFHDLTA